MDETLISAEIMRQVEALGATKSICPTDVARALAPQDWRPLLGPVRRTAVGLVGEGRIDILRKGKPVPPEEMRGVIRFRLRPPGQAADGAESAPEPPDPEGA